MREREREGGVKEITFLQLSIGMHKNCIKMYHSCTVINTVVQLVTAYNLLTRAAVQLVTAYILLTRAAVQLVTAYR